MTIRTLEDAEAYQIRLIQRSRDSGKASSDDLGNMQHILEIIQDRIRDKRERENKP